MWAHLVGKHGEYPYHLSALCCFELAHLVVGLHHFGRLNKHGLSRSRLIVHDTVYLTFHSRRYGYHQSSVSHCRGNVFVHESVFLCRVQYSI